MKTQPLHLMGGSLSHGHHLDVPVVRVPHRDYQKFIPSALRIVVFLLSITHYCSGTQKKPCWSTRSTRSCQPNFESDIKKEYETPGTWGVFFIISPVLPNKNLHHHHHHHHHRHLTLIRLPLWATEPNSNFDHRSMLPPEMESCTFYQEFKPPLKDINIWVGFHKGKLFQLKWLEAISQKRSKNKLFGKLKHQLNRDIHVSFCKDVLFLLGILGVQFWSAETQHTWKTMSRCFVSETLPKLMSSCYFVHSIKTCSRYFQIL